METQTLILAELLKVETGLSFDEICDKVDKEAIVIKAALYDLIYSEEVKIINKKYHVIS